MLDPLVSQARRITLLSDELALMEFQGGGVLLLDNTTLGATIAMAAVSDFNRHRHGEATAFYDGAPKIIVTRRDK